MTRKAHITKINKAKAKQVETLIINATTGLLKDEYKKKNGEWNISKLANDLNLSRTTIYKYL